MSESKKNKNKRKLSYKVIIGWTIVLLIFLAALLITLGIQGWNSTGLNFFFDNVLTKNFLGIPAVLLSLLTLVGYLILGRGIRESIIGALKTAIGVLLLAVGSSALINLAKPIFIKISDLGTSVTPLDPYLGWVSSQNYINGLLGNSISTGFIAWVSYAFIIGFVINILMVLCKKITNCHSLMITGHVMLQQSSIVVASVFFLAFRTDDPNSLATQIGTFTFSGLILGIYWSIASNLTIKGTQKVTNNGGFAIGHQQMLSIALTTKIARFFGSPNNSAENRKMSKKFKIFEDNIFTQSVIVLTLFLVLILVLQFNSGWTWDPGKTPGFQSWNIAGGAYWLINWFLGSLQLVAALIAIITGVRMFVTELQQSFQGISEKVIPGAVVAIDVAATYGFSPNSVTYGFVAGTIGQFIGVGLVLGLSFIPNIPIVIVVPLFITLFFSSGSLGVYANAYGGIKAAILIPLIFGIVEIIICSFALWVFANPLNGGSVIQVIDPAGNITLSGTGANPFETGYIGMSDWTFFYSIMNLLVYGNRIATWILFPLVLLVGIVFGQITDTTMTKKQTVLQKLFKLKINEGLSNSEIDSK